MIGVLDVVNNKDADLKLDLSIVGDEIVLTAENGDSTQQAVTKIAVGDIPFDINYDNVRYILSAIPVNFSANTPFGTLDTNYYYVTTSSESKGKAKFIGQDDIIVGSFQSYTTNTVIEQIHNTELNVYNANTDYLLSTYNQSIVLHLKDDGSIENSGLYVKITNVYIDGGGRPSTDAYFDVIETIGTFRTYIKFSKQLYIQANTRPSIRLTENSTIELSTTPLDF